MTDAEIIKNLECCTNDDDEPNCKECTKRPHIYCMCELLEEALDLIKRQQERMDKIIEQLEGMVQYNRDLMLHYSGRRDITVPIGYQTRGIEIAIEAAKFVMKGGAE